MDNNHVDEVVKKNENNNTIFTIFDELTAENGKNGKPCISLIKSLQGAEHSVGTGSNTQYSLKRLVKGLCSTRYNTQCACFAALTSVLKFHTVNVKELLEAIDKEMSLEGATKLEEGYSNAGCLLTCGAVIHSGKFKDQTEEIQQEIITKIVGSGKARSYLTILSYQLLMDVAGEVDFKTVIWPVCKPDLKEVKTADDFYLLFECFKRRPKLVGKFIEKNLMSFEVVVRNCLTLLLGATVRQNHPLHNCYSQLLVSNAESLGYVIERLNRDVRFQDSKLIRFLDCMLKNIKDASMIPKFLTPKVIETFLRVLAYNRGKALSPVEIAGKEFLDKIIEVMKGEDVSDQVRLEVIEKFNLYPANLKFELKTGSKAVYLITLQLKNKGVKDLTKFYQKILDGKLAKKYHDGNSEEWTSKDQQLVLRNLAGLINHAAVKDDSTWKLSLIKYIYNIAFLKKIKASSEVLKSAKEYFMKVIELKMQTLEDLVLLLDELLVYVNENLPEGCNQEAWVKMFTTVEKLKKKNNKKSYIALHLLLIYMGFQLFADSSLAESTIDELLSCYGKLKHKKNDSDEELHWTEVTVDLILSLLSRENRLWRHVVGCVFPQVVKYMTPSALHQIIDALDPNSDKILSHPDSDESDSGEEEEEGEDEEEEDSASSLTDIEEDDGEEKVSDQLRVAIRQALGKSAAAGSDEESVDMDAMDEEEEKRLNENLSAAFKLFKSHSNEKKKKQSKEDETLMHFRLRVLDLVEIFLAHNLTLSGIIDLIIPCFDLYEFSIKDVHQKPLQTRMESILKKLSPHKKPENDSVTPETITSIFHSLMEKKEVSNLMFVEMAPRIAEVCSFLVRCSQDLASDTVLLASEYNSMLVSFFQGQETRLPITIFHSVLRILWEGNWTLAGTLFQFLADSNTRFFKKNQAIQMLLTFYNNQALHQSASNETKSEFTKTETEFAANFYKFVTENEKIRTAEAMSSNFFSSLLNLIKIACSSHDRNRKSLERPPWNNLLTELLKIDAVTSNNKSRGLAIKLGKLLGVTIPKIEKRKRTVSVSSVKSEASVEGKQDAVNGNKKKSKENVKFKQESKKLREEAASKGLEDVNFSAVNYDSLPEPEIPEEERNGDVKTPKKRKTAENVLNGNVLSNDSLRNNKKLKT